MIREITYKISANTKDVIPATKQWAGMQYEDNATKLIFDLSELLSSKNKKASDIYCRIDFNSSSAGYQPSENLNISEDFTISREIPATLTQYGGEMQVTAVITDKLNASVYYSFPVTVFFTAVSKESHSETLTVKNISAMEETVKEYVKQAESAAKETKQLKEDLKGNGKNYIGIITDIVYENCTNDKITLKSGNIHTAEKGDIVCIDYKILDFNGDGKVDDKDKELLMKATGGLAKYDKKYDLNNDGVINSLDLSIFKKSSGLFFEWSGKDWKTYNSEITDLSYSGESFKSNSLNPQNAISITAAKPGLKTTQGGEVFNDTENNTAAENSHAEGISTKSEGVGSHTEGHSTLTGAKAFILTAMTSSGDNLVITLASKTDKLSVGDPIWMSVKTSYDDSYITIDEKYGCKIISINNNGSATKITVDGGIPSLAGAVDVSGKDSYFVCVNKPTAGDTVMLRDNPFGNYAHAEGENTIASGYASHSGGINTIAAGKAAFAHGQNLSVTKYNTSAAFGNRNLEEENAIFTIGNGYLANLSDGNTGEIRKNAFVVKQSNPNCENYSEPIAWAEVESQGTTEKSVIIKSTLDSEISEISEKVSNSLKGKKTSSAVTIDDVSPIEHTLSVKISSKNLVPFPYLISGTVTQNGITAKVNNDGSLTVSGTATSDVWLKVDQFPLPKGTYRFTGCPTGATDINTYFLRYDLTKSTDSNTTLVVTDDNQAKSLYLYVKKGYNFTEAALFKPQIEEGTEITEFTPYVADLTKVNVATNGGTVYEPASYTPSSDGTVTGVTSVYPTTNIAVDTEGVIIDCEYNRDINKAYTELLKRVELLEEEINK